MYFFPGLVWTKIVFSSDIIFSSLWWILSMRLGSVRVLWCPELGLSLPVEDVGAMVGPGEGVGDQGRSC